MRLKICALTLLIFCASILAADETQRWQTSTREGETTVVIVTYADGSTKRREYKPLNAWISGNVRGLEQADIYVNCSAHGPMLTLKNREYRATTTSHSAQIYIDARPFYEHVKSNGSKKPYFEYEFRASKRLIAAMKRGTTIKIVCYGQDIWE